MSNHGEQLQRFVTAQDAVYADVFSELDSGRKTSHWMWFVFPQLRGLGHSGMAIKYGLASANEALAYRRHHVLGVRLRECAGLVLAVEAKSVRYPRQFRRLEVSVVLDAFRCGSGLRDPVRTSAGCVLLG